MKPTVLERRVKIINVKYNVCSSYLINPQGSTGKTVWKTYVKTRPFPSIIDIKRRNNHWTMFADLVVFQNVDAFPEKDKSRPYRQNDDGSDEIGFGGERRLKRKKCTFSYQTIFEKHMLHSRSRRKTMLL